MSQWIKTESREKMTTKEFIENIKDCSKDCNMQPNEYLEYVKVLTAIRTQGMLEIISENIALMKNKN